MSACRCKGTSLLSLSLGATVVTSPRLGERGGGEERRALSLGESERSLLGSVRLPEHRTDYCIVRLRPEPPCLKGKGQIFSQFEEQEEICLMDMSGDGSDRAFTIVAETRRRWSEAEKRRIVEEASGSCTNVSAVARRSHQDHLARWPGRVPVHEKAQTQAT